MTKTEIKQMAQDELMAAMQTAFNMILDTSSGSCKEDTTIEEREMVMAEASKQMERIEKLFGYTPSSWNRGV